MKNFELIPVIDLKGGEVVQAYKGQRENYWPINTPLATSSDPIEVSRALLDFSGASTLYVADLDAISETGSNRAEVLRLIDAMPNIEIWVDEGVGGSLQPSYHNSTDEHVAVVGSESIPSLTWLKATQADFPENYILSLDFGESGFMGPEELLNRPELWPNRIIAMTLARVGVGAGPDIDRLKMIVNLAGEKKIYAAGGVRNARDVEHLEALGLAGALVASALHKGERF